MRQIARTALGAEAQIGITKKRFQSVRLSTIQMIHINPLPLLQDVVEEADIAIHGLLILEQHFDHVAVQGPPQ
jgi:hypothetical protein